MRAVLTLCFALVALPAGAASLADLAPRAERGDLEPRERELLDGLLTVEGQAVPAAALLLGDAEARGDSTVHCATSAVLTKSAPDEWAAEALLEAAKCALRSGDPTSAADLALSALRAPSGFRGGADRALLAADLQARARTAVVVLAAEKRSASQDQVSAAEQSWHEFSARAQDAGDLPGVNRARRLLGDLNAFRLNPTRGLAVAEVDILGFPAGAGPWLQLAAKAKAAEEAPKALADLGPRGFREVAWGASMKAVVKAERKDPVDDEDGRLVFEDRLAGRACGVVYTFDKGRLHEGAYVFKEPYRGVDDALDHYRSLKEMLASKYGAPVRQREVRWSRDADDDSDDGRRGLVDGEASYETSWSFERTRIRVRLKRKRGDYKLRVVYKSVSEERRSEERRRKKDAERHDADLGKL